MEKSHIKGADEDLVSIFLFIIINILSIGQFPAGLSLQLTFQQFYPFKGIGNLCRTCRKIGQGHHRVMKYIHIMIL